MKPCQTAYYPPIETASSMSTCLIENKTKKKCVYSNVPDNMYLTLAIKNQVSVNHDLIIKDSFGFKILVPFCAGLQDLSTRSTVQPVRSVFRCRSNSLHESKNSGCAGQPAACEACRLRPRPLRAASRRRASSGPISSEQRTPFSRRQAERPLFSLSSSLSPPHRTSPVCSRL